MRSIVALAAITAVLFAASASAQGLSTTILPGITVPYDKTLRPNTTFVPIDMKNGGVPDIRVVDNYTETQPQQIHLGLASTQVGNLAYWVMWATGHNKTGTGQLTPNNPNSVATIVQYGLKPDHLDLTAIGAAEVYSQIYNNGDPYNTGLANTPFATNYTSPIIHSCIVPKLQPGTPYFYRVGDGVTWSDVYNFTTIYAKGPKYPQRLLFIADLGLSFNSTTTLYHVLISLAQSESPTAILNIGDMSYADNVNANGTFGQLAGLPGQVPYYIFTAGEGVSSNTYQPVWDAWLRFLQPLLTQIPHLATPGNHEIEQQSVTTKLFNAYRVRLKNAHTASSSPSYQFYSADIGPVHNIFLSPYEDFRPGSDQYDWFLNDLISIDRTLTPWVTLNVHNPWVTSDGSFKEWEQMRITLEPLAYKYGVDIFTNGHVHSYERTNPVYNYLNDKCGIVHITIGDGGNAEGLSGLGNDVNGHSYEDSPGGCPQRSTSLLTDANVGTAAVPRPYRPGYLTPNDANPAPALIQSKTDFDPFNYYLLDPTFQGDGNTTGATAAQKAANPPGYCWKEQAPWSAYRESSFGHGTLDVINGTHALWRWIRNQDTETGPAPVVADQIYIYRDPTCTNKAGVPQTPAAPAAPASIPAQIASIGDQLGQLHHSVFGFEAQPNPVTTSLESINPDGGSTAFETPPAPSP